MNLRTYTPADASALADIYRQSALSLGLQAYTSEQTLAWARWADETEAFEATLAAGLTLCAMDEERPVAFASLHPIDHVAYLYCAPAHARRGYATELLTAVEAHARAGGVDRLTTEASCVARPCFERFGFEVVEEERVDRGGIEFLRYKMAKILT